jgi:microsomal epoxide hydrolase
MTCRRAVETEINSFPNYHLPIPYAGSSFDIHFVALFSERKDAVPILMLHGWPGSFLEFLPILRLLTNKYTPSTLPYHIVVPSLPGYAYSSPPPHDADFRLEDVCQVLDELMVQLASPLASRSKVATLAPSSPA